MEKILKNKGPHALNATKFYIKPTRCNGNTYTYMNLNQILIVCMMIACMHPVAAIPQEQLCFDVVETTSISKIIEPSFYDLVSLKYNMSDEEHISTSVSWSPDSSKIMVYSRYAPVKNGFVSQSESGLNALYILNADGTEQREIISTPIAISMHYIPVKGPAKTMWDPNGDKVTFMLHKNEKTIFVIADTNDGTFRAVGTDYTTADTIAAGFHKIPHQKEFKWSPDGTCAFLIIDDKLYQTDRTGSTLKLISTPGDEKISSFEWDNVGDRIAFCGEHLWVINRDGSGLLRINFEDYLTGSCSLIKILGFGHDNSRIYYSCNSPDLRNNFVSYINNSSTIKINNQCTDDYLLLSKNGKILFTNSRWDGSTLVSSQLFVADADAKDRQLLGENNTTHAYLIVPAIWSPDGNYIASAHSIFSQNGTKLNDLVLGQWFTWHPSSKYLAFYNWSDRVVSLIRHGNNSVITVSPRDAYQYNLNYFTQDSWSPDGSRVIINRILNENWDGELLVLKFDGYDEPISIAILDDVIFEEEFTLCVKSMSSPLQGAMIELDGIEIGETDADGHLKLKIDTKGRHILHARKDGYRKAVYHVAMHEPVCTESRETGQRLPGSSLTYALPDN